MVRCWRALAAVAALACLAGQASAARIYYFPFEKPGGEGWSMTGEWEYGAPQGLGGDPSSAVYPGGYVYGYDLSGDGRYANNLSTEYLTTTALDCRGFRNVQLRFQRWLGVESASWDHAAIYVSNDGASWTPVWWHATGSVQESAWTQVTYDISTVADGEATVYIRWEMGPTDSSITYGGWNIDNVELLGDPATEVVAWTAVTDTAQEYPNTLAALNAYYTSYNLTETTTTDPGQLEAVLEGRHVLLLPEPELSSTAALEAQGEAFADVLHDFVSAGGTVVALCEWANYQGFLRAAGLMDATFVGPLGGTATVALPSHPLATGLGATAAYADATGVYEVGPGVATVVEAGDGTAVVAARQLGAGAVVLIGYDYYEYNDDASRILANAVQYPRKFVPILLCDDSRMGTAAEALNRLGYAHTATGYAGLNTDLASQPWQLVVVDEPANKPSGGWTTLTTHVTAGNQVIVSSWDLGDQLYDSDGIELCAALGATPGGNLGAPATVTDWDADGPPIFAFRQSVPASLAGWTDRWGVNANPLTVDPDHAMALAGFTVDPAAGQAAIAFNTHGRGFLNGFLWDDRDQDSDADGIQDMVELVMNQVLLTLWVPMPSMDADPTVTLIGLPVEFRGDALGHVSSWAWSFGDGEGAAGQNRTHAYANPGHYTVALTVTNANGSDTAVRKRYIVVGFTDTPTDYWAFYQIIACYEAGVVAGYPGGVYEPDWVVARDQMAVYIARALAGGDDAVPPGPGTASFTDVATDYWAFKYVEYAVAQGVVTGYPDDTYRPGDAVNRGQMAVYIARALAGSDAGVPDPPVAPTFADVTSDNEWAWCYKHVEYIVDQGVASGYGDSLYHPEVQVTRDQMAVYVQRAWDLPLD